MFDPLGHHFATLAIKIHQSTVKQPFFRMEALAQYPPPPPPPPHPLVSYPDPNVRNDDHRLQYDITYRGSGNEVVRNGSSATECCGTNQIAAICDVDIPMLWPSANRLQYDITYRGSGREMVLGMSWNVRVT